MPGLSSALLFIFVLGVLVIVHEFGHFIVAKWVGVRVEKFSIGFGPMLFGKKYGETEFCVSLLPLGGFVKLAGESPEDAKGMSWEFNSKSLLQKFAIVFAGPLMNAFLAFLLFTAIFLVGQPTMTSKIGKVLADAPAQAAGLLEGDRIIQVNGRPVELWEELLAEVHQAGDEMALTVKRGDAVQDFKVAPRVQETKDIFGRSHRLPFIGIAPANEMVHIKSGVFEAVGLGAERVWTLTRMIFLSLGLMITGAMPFKESMTGPIGIFFMTQQAADMGAVYLFYFMGSLSVSLFVLNLLPIPVLDGGHVLFIIIERLKGSPLKDSTKERMTQVGLFLLLGLMAFVIFQDIHRFAIFENIKKFFIRS